MASRVSERFTPPWFHSTRPHFIVRLATYTSRGLAWSSIYAALNGLSLILSAVVFVGMGPMEAGERRRDDGEAIFKKKKCVECFIPLIN